MTLGQIALRNLLRRKGKSAFVLSGLVIAVATVVGVISLTETMTADINHKLEKFGANILVVPRSEQLSLSYGGITLGGVAFDITEIHMDEVARIQGIKNSRNIAALGPIVLGVVPVGDRKVLMAGIDFTAATILKPWWKIDGSLPNDHEVVLGSDAAKHLSLGIGDRLAIATQPPMTVSGVLAPTGAQDDGLIFTGLATAQRVLSKPDRVSMIEVAALCQDCPIDDMVVQIGRALPNAKVMAIQQVVKGRMETLGMLKQFALGVACVVLVVGVLVVLTTMMGSVRERTEEIGIFRAIGFRRRHVMRIVFTEAALISLMAGILGYVMGNGVGRLAAGFFNQGTIAVWHWNLPMAGAALILSLALGLGASAYPAVMASRMDPTTALRAL